MPDPKDVQNTNPLLTAFQYKKPLRHLRRRSGAESISDSTSFKLVERIHELSDSLRTELAPRFDQLENELDKSVVQVRQKVDQLDDLQQQVRSVVASFTSQTASSKQEVDGNLDKLRAWLAQPRDVEDLKRRLAAAREQLRRDTTRLEELNRAVSQKLSERHQNERNEVARYRFLSSAILFAFIAFIYFVMREG